VDQRQEYFYRRQRQSTRYNTGEQWTKGHIELFWTRGNTLWKDRCAVAHAPGEASPDNISARSRQAAQQRVEMAYAHARLMLAHDRRVLEVPLEERMQSRTYELLAWAKSMLPVINRSVRDARAQLQTGHQDIRSCFSQATVATTNQTAARPTATRPARPDVSLVDTTAQTATTPIVTNPARRPNLSLLDIRQHFESARMNQDGHDFLKQYDIRQYLTGTADGGA
jgi:hypothetical protein